MKIHWHRHLLIKKRQMVAQLVAAVLYVLLALVVLDMISDSPIMWAVGSSSLASSAYLIFASPCTRTASAARLVGAYFIAIICGVLMRHVGGWMMDWHWVMLLDVTHDPHMYWLTGAISVGVSMFFMLLLGLEHPPAAGMALVLVIEERSYEAIVTIFLLAVLLAIIKMFFRKCLSDVT